MLNWTNVELFNFQHPTVNIQSANAEVNECQNCSTFNIQLANAELNECWNVEHSTKFNWQVLNWTNVELFYIQHSTFNWRILNWTNVELFNMQHSAFIWWMLNLVNVVSFNILKGWNMTVNIQHKDEKWNMNWFPRHS